MTTIISIPLTDHERLLVAALREAWHVMNTIRAQDGTAFHGPDSLNGGMRTPYFPESEWSRITERCATTIKYVTGDDPPPWPYGWEREI